MLIASQQGGESSHVIVELAFAQQQSAGGDTNFTFHVDVNGDGTIDLVFQGPASTEIPLTYSQSGNYNVVVQAMLGSELVAEGTTSVVVSPVTDGSGKVDFNPMKVDIYELMDFFRNEDWRNTYDAKLDVIGDGRMTPRDLLILVNNYVFHHFYEGTDASETLPTVSLSNDTGISGDGLTNDLSLSGTLGAGQSKLFISLDGHEAVHEVSHAAVDGVFALPHGELEDLFGPFDDGDYKFRLWSGGVDAAEWLKTRVHVAYDGTSPGSFVVETPISVGGDSLRFDWSMALGAYSYQMYVKNESEESFIPIGPMRQTEFVVLPQTSVLPGPNMIFLIAIDAVGNLSQSNIIEFQVDYDFGDDEEED